MSEGLSGLIESILGFVTELLGFLPEDTKSYITPLIIIISLLILTLLIYIIIIKPIIKLFSTYIERRKEHAKARIEDPSGFVWGNSLLRAPLLAIGTDIYAFAQSSIQSKTIRYIKATSVFVPVAWCTFSVILLIHKSKKEVEGIDLYVLGLPVLLIGITIFILDLSLIVHKGRNRAQIPRMLIAIITGYLFSSIPLDYIYKADIDSFLKINDEQLAQLKDNTESEKKKIEEKDWYKRYKELESKLTTLLQSMEEERVGKGATSKPNNPDPKKNTIYNQIKQEYDLTLSQFNLLTTTNQTELEKLKQLELQLQTDIKYIQDANSSNHIKRHLMLWKYALSSLGTAIFFFCCIILFWLVDSLAVIVSFLNESEYYDIVKTHNNSREDTFKDQIFKDRFSPIIVEGSL